MTRKFLLTPIEVKRGQRAAAAPFAKVVGDDKLIGQQIQEQAADGTLIVRGCLRVSFQTGQRTAIAHIAFCPAFVELPVVQATVRDPDRQNGESRIKIAQVVPQGVRFEVKLSRAADSKVFVIVDFTAMGLGSVCQ